MASGPISTRMRSPAAHGPSTPARFIAWLRWSSTVCAARRSASSRSAVRFSGLKKLLGRETGGLGQVDLALGHALAQFRRRDVDQLDLVGAAERAVRHRLALAHAGDLPDHVDQAFQMLDVQRRPDVDTGLQQLLDILPALGMAAAGRIGMGVLVDQEQASACRARAASRSNSIRVPAAVLERPARHDLEPVEQVLRLAPAMGLDHADQDFAMLVLSTRLAWVSIS
jgi:hypothetical protein